MRWFTDEAYEADDERWAEICRAYNAHISEIIDSLPPDLASLASTVDLHDGRFLTVLMDEAEKTVEMRIALGDRVLRLTFGGAAFVSGNLQAIAYAVGAVFATDHWGTTRTVIRAQELDIAEDGRFLLRLRLWPFHELALAFDSLSLDEEAAAQDDGQPGRFAVVDVAADD